MEEWKDGRVEGWKSGRMGRLKAADAAGGGAEPTAKRAK
jgi:hypothetical protein